jgi:hypothetical protein
MKLFKALLFIAASFLAFFIGRQIGKDKLDVLCATDQSSLQASRLQRENSLNRKRETEKCDKSVVVFPKIKPQAFPICLDQSNRNITIFRKGDASVPPDLFSYLHHPGNPAKQAFFLTNFAKWKTNKVQDSPCQEVILTRTGSRASQPNKCVSIVLVKNGFQSINQQSHRVGYTALNTDQYQKDFPIDYNNRANTEPVLLFPFLEHRQ